jgi:hypothetical protein
MIKFIAAATAAAAAAAVTLVVVEGPTASGATLVAICKSRFLKPVFGGTDGTAGTLHDKWRIVNKDSASCSVSGYPTVTNYRADGRPLPTAVTQTGKFGAIVLAPGQHASFVLSYPDPGIAGCTPQHPARMTIFVTGTQLPLIASRGERACPGSLQESPLVHGG